MIMIKVTDLVHNKEIGTFTLKELCMANPFIDYGERNLRVELIEREPSAKEKYEEYRKNMQPDERGYNSFIVGQLAGLADAAIKEAEEK